MNNKRIATFELVLKHESKSHEAHMGNYLYVLGNQFSYDLSDTKLCRILTSSEYKEYISNFQLSLLHIP